MLTLEELTTFFSQYGLKLPEDINQPLQVMKKIPYSQWLTWMRIKTLSGSTILADTIPEDTQRYTITPLQFAVIINHHDVIMSLLAHHADHELVVIVDNSPMTLLDIACLHNQLTLIETLVSLPNPRLLKPYPHADIHNPRHGDFLTVNDDHSRRIMKTLITAGVLTLERPPMLDAPDSATLRHLFDQLYGFIERQHRLALSENKWLYLIVGEHHFSKHAYFMDVAIYLISRHLGIQEFALEWDPRRLSDFSRAHRHDPRHTTFTLLHALMTFNRTQPHLIDMAPVVFQALTDKSMRIRNLVMSALSQLNTQGPLTLFVGAAHLPELLSEFLPDPNKYHTVGIATLSPELASTLKTPLPPLPTFTCQRECDLELLTRDEIHAFFEEHVLPVLSSDTGGFRVLPPGGTAHAEKAMTTDSAAEMTVATPYRLQRELDMQSLPARQLWTLERILSAVKKQSVQFGQPYEETRRRIDELIHGTPLAMQLATRQTAANTITRFWLRKHTRVSPAPALPLAQTAHPIPSGLTS